MDNLNDLKAIWLTAKTDSLPKAGEMVRIVKKFRNQKLYKKVLLIIIALALAAVMVAVMFVYKSVMPTTRIGEVLMIVAAFMLIVTNLRSMRRFYELQDVSNTAFIQFLEQTRLNQIYYYKKTQVIAMILCSAGLLLYLYEGVHENKILCIGAYAATLLYLMIMWFIVRPRVFRKQTKKLEATRERIETIAKQL